MDYVADHGHHIDEAHQACEELISDGFVSDVKAARQQITELKRSVKKLTDRAKSRDDELAKTLKKLENFYENYSGVMDDLNNVSTVEMTFLLLIFKGIYSIIEQ